jgi:hypothetical protein
MEAGSRYRMEKTVTFRGNSPAAGAREPLPKQSKEQVFLLSPAHLKGKRAERLRQNESLSEISVRLRAGGATIADVFSFASPLYFRGKLAYARAFGGPPPGLELCYVITSSRGLLPPDTRIDLASLDELASGGAVDPDDDRYRIPLERDALSLKAKLGAAASVILLGSIATPKYAEPLLGVFGGRLLFPSDFAGRGNMSRGSLLMRCVREGRELDYVSVAGLPRAREK